MQQPAPIDSRDEIAIRMEAAAWTNHDAAAICRRAAGAALAAAGPRRPAELSIVLADDATVRELNRRYRGRDVPTNVLSFTQQGGSEAPALPEDAPLLLGDVVLAYERVRAECHEQGKAFDDHLSHLVVHGTLHLLGHEHDNPTEAAAMETLEREILARLGIADPYAVRPGPLTTKKGDERPIHTQ
ncbi:MAG: rRNA maturation RNase YbeY [Alphaproteobacteria bacterium]